MKIKIGSKRLKEENHATFLGVLVDSTLSWKPHIIELTQKLTKTTGIFYKCTTKIFRGEGRDGIWGEGSSEGCLKQGGGG